MRMLQEVSRILLMQNLISGFEVVMLKAKFQIFFFSVRLILRGRLFTMVLKRSKDLESKIKKFWNSSH